MKRCLLVEEMCQDNSVLSQLFDDWIDTNSPSFWRFFTYSVRDKPHTNEKLLWSWEKLLRRVMKQYDSPNLLMFKSDAKGMVMVLDNCVFRTYRANLFMRIRPLYRLRNPHLERCLMSKQLGHIGVFVCKKIKPLMDTSTDSVRLTMKMTKPLFEQLLRDVEKGIGKIHSYGYCHHDISLDNTGYDEDTKQFVIFDFDAAQRTTIFNRRDLCLDRTSWERSLKAWAKFFPVK